MASRGLPEDIQQEVSGTAVAGVFTRSDPLQRTGPHHTPGKDRVSPGRNLEMGPARPEK